MVNLKEDLLVHLKMDRIDQHDRLIDATNNKNDAKAIGEPSIQPDDTLGGCLCCDGQDDHMQLPCIQNIKSVCMWVNIPGGQSGDLHLLDVERSEDKAFSIPHIGESWEKMSIDGVDKDVSWESIPQGKWAYVYIQCKDGFDGKVNLMSKWDNNGFLKGKLGSVRIYKKNLTQEDIQRNMRDDKVATISFGESYPIDFRLHDEDDQSVLYIVDKSDEPDVYLEITNTSNQKIEPQNTNGTPVEDDCHFELRFRPGTLSQASLEKIGLMKADGDWKIGKSQVNSDRTVSLYFRCGKVLEANSTEELILQNIKIDGAGGARGTRVELKYRNLKYSNSNTPIAGSREQHLSIVNQRGRKNIPLHVGFVGPNIVLNDGKSENSLKLHITNLLKDGSISLKSGDSGTKFIISFDVQAEGEEKEWALGTASEVENIGVHLPEGWNCKKETEGESPEWILTPECDCELGPREHIEINLSKIISSTPSGHANLYLRYENVPGYWDGQFVCTIEKAPLLYIGSKVGIGTTDPKSKLSVSGGAAIGSGYAGTEAAPVDGLLVQGRIDIGPGTGTENSPAGVAPKITDWNWNEAIRLSSEYHSAITHYDDKSDTGLLLGFHSGNRMFCFGSFAKDGEKNTFNNAMTIDVDKRAVKISGRISDRTGDVMPIGAIIMWSGKLDSIPEGWVLCNGQNGTPDLRDRFIVGAGSKYAVAKTGGKERVKLEKKEMPIHNHASDVDGNLYSEIVRYNKPGEKDAYDSGGKEHTNRFNLVWHTAMANAGGDAAHENMPPYYSLAFIMKT